MELNGPEDVTCNIFEEEPLAISANVRIYGDGRGSFVIPYGPGYEAIWAGMEGAIIIIRPKELVAVITSVDVTERLGYFSIFGEAFTASISLDKQNRDRGTAKE